MPKLRSSIVPLTVLLAVWAIEPLSAQNNITVPANGSVLLDESASYQNVTVGTGGTLETIDSNSGGAGDHAITITLAAYGAGTIQNDGTIELAGNDQGNTTVFANPVTISGSGTLELLNTYYGFNDASVQGPGTVTQEAGNTIIGGGGNGNNSGPSFSAPLVNSGLVTTNNHGFHLDGASLVNRGTFSATSGSALYLDAPTLDNTNGTITVGDANSLVIVENGSQVTGGTLQCTVAPAVGDTYGDFRLAGGASLANLTIAANAGVNVSDSGALADTVTNNGYLYVPPNTTLNLAGNVMLAGSGTLQVSGHLEGANNATLTINPGETLDLSGQANVNSAPDIIDANLVNNGTLAGTYQEGDINSPAFVNSGSVTASGGSIIAIGGTSSGNANGSSTLDNTKGTITVGDANSVVIIGNGDQVTGGTLECTAPAVYGNSNGLVRLQGGSSLKNVTIAANAGVIVADTGALSGTLTNDGYIEVPGSQFYSTLNLIGDVTVTGSGVFHLGGNLKGANNPTLTIAQGQELALEGTGNISFVPDVISVDVINNGVLAGVYLAGTINSPVFTNNGLLAVNNGCNVSVSSSTNFTNFNATSQTLTGGAYTVTDQGNGATLDFSGRNVLVNAATVTLSGANANFSAINGLTTNAGTLALLNLIQFSTPGALTDTGTITLDAGSTFHVGGAYTASGSKAALAVVIGGTASQGAMSPGILQVNGAATLAGTLALSFSKGATLPSASSTLTIVSATSAVSGSFSNVASGARLTTTDGRASFLVSYGPGSATPSAVVLSGIMSNGGPVINSAPTATATVGQPFSYRITATDSPTSFGVQGLPSGFTVNTTTGVLSGTPKAAGTITLTLNAYNSKGKGSETLMLTVAGGTPVITSADTATATQGKAFSYQITASNSPTSFGVQGLPAGLNVNTKTGLISGTVSGAGKVTLTLNAYNAAGKGSATLTLTVSAAPPVITSAATATATVGKAFSYQITASNQPTSYGVQGLPAGFTVDTKTGIITATPKAAGKVSLTLNAYNATGKGSAPLTLTITQ